MRRVKRHDEIKRGRGCIFSFVLIRITVEESKETEREAMENISEKTIAE